VFHLTLQEYYPGIKQDLPDTRTKTIIFGKNFAGKIILSHKDEFQGTKWGYPLKIAHQNKTGTGHTTYVQHNKEVFLHNHCCCGKAVECYMFWVHMSVAFVVPYYIVICGLSASTILFPSIS